ncbi:GntR family transcriptional regulator [Enterococcus casseliflavus]|nr:GntR family transcriptional regulator [Enterococcus casseliflavus]
MLDIGDTPVREAILQLKREGLLVIRPQSGTFISKINMQQVREAKFVREKLESAIVVEAIGIIDDAQIESLRQIVEMQEIYLKNGNSENSLNWTKSFTNFSTW